MTATVTLDLDQIEMLFYQHVLEIELWKINHEIPPTMPVAPADGARLEWHETCAETLSDYLTMDQIGLVQEEVARDERIVEASRALGVAIRIDEEMSRASDEEMLARITALADDPEES